MALNDIAHFRKMFLENYAQPDDECLPVDTGVIKNYCGILPEELLRYWKEHGWCSYGNGLLWFINPSDYEVLMREYLKDSPYEHRNNIFPIARTAFGKLFVWEKGKGEILHITPSTSLIFFNADTDRQNLTANEEEFEMNRFIGTSCDPDFNDLNDLRDFPLFNKSLKKLGQLKANEMYGYKLSPSLGGKESISNLVKVNLFNYYDIQRQLITPTVAISDTENNTLTYL